MVKERTGELEDMSIETSQTEEYRQKRMKKRETEHPRTGRQLQEM